MNLSLNLPGDSVMMEKTGNEGGDKYWLLMTYYVKEAKLKAGSRGPTSTSFFSPIYFDLFQGLATESLQRVLLGGE